jgi:acetyl-CoA C-acetyltransferase
MTDVVGAHYRGEEKMAQDGLNGLGYAMASIMSGHDDLVLLMGHCKESQSESRHMCTNLAFEPFFTRPLGLDYLNACGLQARSYMDRAGLTDDHLAEVVVRSRRQAAQNPFARDMPSVTAGEVSASPLLADPLRELHYYPATDWAVGMLLCCEERVHEFTDKPVWLTGFGSCLDSFYLGERDLAFSVALQQASRRAFKMAGGIDTGDIGLFELNDAAAHQMPLWAESIGLVPAGEGMQWLETDGPDRHQVNRSGGMLNGNPLMLGGLARALEAFQQLRGEAGARQVDGLQRALAHGTTGPAGQHHAVLIMEN